MALLNYSTGISASKTAAEIQVILAKAKARAVATEYNDAGRPVALAFQVNTPFGMQQFCLPVNADAVFAVLVRDKVTPKFRTRDHAEKVAWRILKDWVEAQLAIVAAQMVTLDQVMLPYLQTDDGATLYDRYVDQRQRALEASNGSH